MCARMKGFSPSVRLRALVLGAVFAGLFSAAAVILPPGGLAATASGTNLILSIQTTSTNYYGLQMCPDLSQPWTNYQAGIQGNGLLKTVTLSNALAGSQGFYRTVIQPRPTHCCCRHQPPLPLSATTAAASRSRFT